MNQAKKKSPQININTSKFRTHLSDRWLFALAIASAASLASWVWLGLDVFFLAEFSWAGFLNWIIATIMMAIEFMMAATMVAIEPSR